jgi:energy-coupling factor transporter ATP-binding protein EcfA2
MYVLKLENIGKIKSANIKFGGLTVLTGFNDIGKSTISKVLWCIVRTITDAHRQRLNRVTTDISNLQSMFLRISEIDYDYFVTGKSDKLKFIKAIKAFDRYADKIRIDETKGLFVISNIVEVLNEIFELIDYEKLVDSSYATGNPYSKVFDIPAILDKIEELNTSGSGKDNLFSKYFNDLIGKVFMQEIRKFQTESSSITLEFYNDTEKQFNQIFSAQAEGNKNSNFKVSYNYSKNAGESFWADATYIESPLLSYFMTTFIQELRSEKLKRNPLYNYPLQLDLVNKIDRAKYWLTKDTISSPDDFDEILELIKRTINGAWEWNKKIDELVFVNDSSKDVSNPDNIAAGIKTFGLLQILARAANITPVDLLILEEPESNLHPEWQIRYGEILVKFVKFGVPIVVSTHSPYILESIHLYAKKYNALDHVNFYMGDNSDGTGVVFEDFTDNVPEVFRKSSEAMQKLYLM